MTKKNRFFAVFLALFLHQTSFNFASAEIINLQKEEKAFGDWKVYCETDVMMDNSHCKIAAKFFDGVSAITIEPSLKSFNQFLMVIPQVKQGSFVKVRIDKNDLVLSDNVKLEDFGFVVIDDVGKNNLYQQMKNGDFLFLRFNVRNSEKEVTIKISLEDFRKASNYYKMKVFHD